MASVASAEIEEIVVSAERRDAGLSTVPMSVQVLSGEELEKTGVAEVKDLFKLSPSIVTIGGSTSASSGLRIRGIGNPGYGEGIEPSVGVVIDGISTGPSGSALSMLFDTDRVEVLRGPQGTLFGKNTTAGLISVTTSGPTDEFEASGRIKYLDEFEDTRLDFAVSGPVSDSVNLRLAGFTRSRNKGETEALASGVREGELDRYGLRFTADWGWDAFSARSSITYIDQDDKCCSRMMVGLDPNPALYGYFLRTFMLPAMAEYGVLPSGESRISMNGIGSVEEMETIHIVHDMSYDFASGFTLRSITGFRNWESYSFNDSDMTPFDIANTEVDRKTNVRSQEFHLLSPEEDGWSYLLGAYLNRTEFTRDVVYTGGSDYPVPGAGTSGTSVLDAVHTVYNYALFGNARYEVSDALAVFAGARLIREKHEVEGIRYGNMFIFPGVFSPTSGSTSDRDWSARLGLEYHTSEDTMLYATFARGYKGKAVDFGSNGTLYTGDPDETWVDPETVVSGEFGVKTSLFDKSALLNANLFFQRYDGYQAESVDAQRLVRTLHSEGELETKGIEIEFRARPIDTLDIAASFTYIDAEFTDLKGGPCTIQQIAVEGGNCFRDFSGEKLAGVPKYAYNLSVEKLFPLSNGMSWHLRGEYSWRDDITYGLDLDPNTTQDAYGLLNVRAGIQLNDNFEVIGFLENATDEFYALLIEDMTIMTGAYSGYVGAGRTWGIELRANF